MLIEGTYTFWSGATRFADTHYTWSSGSPPGGYRLHNAVFFDDNPSPVTPFREEPHFHRYWFYYQGTGTCLAIFVRTPSYFKHYQGSPPELTITLSPMTALDQAFLHMFEQQEWNRLLQLHEKEWSEAHAKRRQERAEQEARHHDRLYILQAQYGEPYFAWRDDDRRLWRYAHDYRRALLQNERKIIADFIAFHKDHELIELFRTKHPELYGRCDPVFYHRVLELARQPAAPMSSEDRRHRAQQRLERFQEDMQHGIDLNTLQAVLAFESTESLFEYRDTKVREITERQDLEPDEKKERITALEAIVKKRLEELTLGETPDATTPNSGQRAVTLGDV